MTVALFTIVFFVYQSMNEKSIRLPWKKQTYVQHENGAYDVGDLIIVQAEVQQVTFNEQRNEYELTIIADDKTITLKVDAANSELDVGDLIEIEGYIESMNDNDIQLELTEIISQ